jgi:hypothetical protein
MHSAMTKTSMHKKITHNCNDNDNNNAVSENAKLCIRHSQKELKKTKKKRVENSCCKKKLGAILSHWTVI